MAISLVCACGARLEIDDKFAGKMIPCPDCQRPLQAALPEPPSPHNQRTSGLAVASLALALVGAFTLVGSVAAVVLGFLAQREIARQPERLSGLAFARAGMIVGGVCTFITLGLLASSDIFGIDALLREFNTFGKLEYKAEPDGRIKSPLQDNTVVIMPPAGRWGKITVAEVKSDRLILYNVREDAHLVCVPLGDFGDDLATARDKAVQKFLASDFVKLLSRPGERPGTPEGEAKPIATDDPKEVIVNLRLGGFDRTFLIRVQKQAAGETFVVAGGTRKGRFQRLREELRQALASFKVEL